MTRLLSCLTLALLVFGFSFGDQRLSAQSAEVIGNSGGGKISVIKSPKFDPMESTQEDGVQNAVVEQNPIYITVIGQVGKPGVYEFFDAPPSLEDLIGKYAGGLTPYSRREFYVFRQSPSGLIQQQLDVQRHSLFQFEDGDILLAETPKRYYEKLAFGETGPSFKDLHSQTQIVLLNILDRPVLFSVNPENARLAGLLKLMQQDASAMEGVTYTEPPHADHIPMNAGIPPNTILSGSILSFKSKAIVRNNLPDLPSPIRIVSSDKLKVASSEFTVPSIEHPSGYPLTTENSLSSQEKKSWNLPPVSTNNPAELPGEPSKKEGKALPSRFNSKEFTKLNDAFEEMQESDTELPPEDIADSVVPQSTDEGTMLSSQQTAYLISFLIIVTLFSIAWYIRQRQVINGFNRLSTAEERYSNYIQSTRVPESGSTEGQKTAIASDPSETKSQKLENEERNLDQHDQEEESVMSEVSRNASNLTSASRSVLSERMNLYKEDTVTTAEVSNQKFLQESGEVPEQADEEDVDEPEVAVKQEELEVVAEHNDPIKQVDESVAPEAVSDTIQPPEKMEASTEQPKQKNSAFVPHSIMDNPLMRELLEEHARLLMESAQADKVTPPEEIEPPAAETPMPTVEPPVAETTPPAPTKKFRIDQAHATAPKPLFPIVWKNTTAGEQEAKINRYQAGEPRENAEEKSDRVDPQSSPIAGSHMKMKDPEPISGEGDADDAKLFDRVFRAVMRERQKK